MDNIKVPATAIKKLFSSIIMFLPKLIYINSIPNSEINKEKKHLIIDTLNPK